MQRYAQKFGESRLQAMIPHMKAVGNTCGIRFSYKGKIANTLNSHKLLELSLEKGGPALQDKVVENLFSAYFEKEENLGDIGVLTKAAEAAGISEEDAKTYLNSKEGEEKVKSQLLYWRSKYNIMGVPLFVLKDESKNEITTISGAQEPAEFIRIFNSISE